ncbi:IPT/TIG domain-containing protein [Streptomyces kronopolitis]|uniref:IPT/TIG domain-containing protein n=1 Tax=Streptomyces kronopolitis TaxID=1612435 RepID=UPI0036A138CA
MPHLSAQVSPTLADAASAGAMPSASLLLLACTTLPAGTSPFAVAVAPNGNVYVTNSASGNVTVIDSVTNAVIATLPAGTQPLGVAVAPNGNIYVANFGSSNVSVFPPYPALTGISPTQGPTTGGTVVALTGTNLTGANVTIGGNPATNLFYNLAGTQIIATTPAGVAGPATVTVTTCGGTASLPAAFTYTAVPTLTGISPACGPSTGGTVVTITGTNLAGATVTIGGNPATNLFYNPGGTQITATTPAGVAGAATVTVTTACGGTASLPAAFTYTNPVHPTQLTATPALIQLFPLQLHFPFLSATLIDSVTGLPVPGQTITFSTGGHVLGTAVTDATGTARHLEVLSLALIILNGGYDATFAGTPTLQPSTAHAGVLTF